MIRFIISSLFLFSSISLSAQSPFRTADINQNIVAFNPAYSGAQGGILARWNFQQHGSVQEHFVLADVSIPVLEEKIYSPSLAISYRDIGNSAVQQIAVNWGNEFNLAKGGELSLGLGYIHSQYNSNLSKVDPWSSYYWSFFEQVEMESIFRGSGAPRVTERNEASIGIRHLVGNHRFRYGLSYLTGSRELIEGESQDYFDNVHFTASAILSAFDDFHLIPSLYIHGADELAYGGKLYYKNWVYLGSSYLISLNYLTNRTFSTLGFYGGGIVRSKKLGSLNIQVSYSRYDEYFAHEIVGFSLGYQLFNRTSFQLKDLY